MFELVIFSDHCPILHVIVQEGYFLSFENANQSQSISDGKFLKAVTFLSSKNK